MAQSLTGLEVAIVGASCRLPGAADLDAYADLLREGRVAIRRLTDAELLDAGADPGDLADPAFVRFGAVVEDEQLFDAGYFGLTPREAELLDPQQRFFLECAVSALEHAAQDPDACGRRVGVFASASANTYLLRNVWPNAALRDAVGAYSVLLAGEKDYLATRTAYKLDLRGPAITVQTACSSSLVAVHLAVQSLLSGDCDLALAGGATIRVPQRTGYRAGESGIASADGACRPFDAGATGMLDGNGAAVVVLKRLDAALADRDEILAVIRGSAVNNDGAAKVGFTAPSADGQEAVIRAALAVAEAGPESIGFVEAHGTATALGDPLEFRALTRVYGERAAAPWCALGSVKSAIGHLDAASGVAGLIKAALALHDGRIPAHPTFREANPAVPLEHSPFFVNTAPATWRTSGPRRAAVSSLGIGGTNAHVILEQAPPRPGTDEDRPRETLLLSALSEQALAEAAAQLADNLEAEPGRSISDIAYTTQTGRTARPHRSAVLAGDLPAAAAALRAGRVLTGTAASPGGPQGGAVFLFAGQGFQDTGRSAEFYRSDDAYRAAVDECLELLDPVLADEVRSMLCSERGADPERVRRTELAQPAVFTAGYAMARALGARGLRPAGLIGHSVGEFVAAQQAGIFALDDALAAVVARGKAVAAQPPGAMLAVPLAEAELAGLLAPGVAVAAVNAPDLCVASGPADDIEELAEKLRARSIVTQRLATAQAFHSPSMDAAVPRLERIFRQTPLRRPRIPVFSAVTGRRLTDEQAVDPLYWARQLRAQVRFADAVAAAGEGGLRHFVDASPRPALGRLVRRQAPRAVVATTRSERRVLADADDPAVVFDAMAARIWVEGGEIDWRAARGTERRGRTRLPTYPFQRRRYWIDAPGPSAVPDSGQPLTGPEAPAESRTDAPGKAEDVGGSTESAVREIWRTVLGIDDLGPDDDFFERGGHSLAATQVLAGIRADLGAELTMAQFFAGPTIAELAAAVEAGARAGSPSEVETAAETEPAPLTAAQASLWFLQRLAPGSPSYALVNNVGLRGTLDPRALGRAIGETVERHAILRTSFPTVKRRPIQLVGPAPEVRLDVVDIASPDPGETAARAAETARTVARAVTDLAQGPPWAAALMRTGEDEHVLCLAIHHICADYWSIGLVVNEILDRYDHLARSAAYERPAPPVSFAEVARWEAGPEQSARRESQLAYWTRHYEHPPQALDLPADLPRPALPTFTGGSVPVRLGRSLSDALDGLAREHSATAFMVLLAGYALLLHELTGQRDLAVGSYVAGRPRREFESVVGLFARALPFRVDLDGDPTGAELIARIREECLAAYDNQDVSVDAIVRGLRLEREADRNPLFQTMFVLETAPAAIPGAQGLEVRVETPELGTAKFDLTLVLFPGDEGYAGFLEYSADLFHEATIARAARRLESALARLADRPRARLSELAPVGRTRPLDPSNTERRTHG